MPARMRLMLPPRFDRVMVQGSSLGRSLTRAKSPGQKAPAAGPRADATQHHGARIATRFGTVDIGFKSIDAIGTTDRFWKFCPTEVGPTLQERLESGCMAVFVTHVRF